MWDASGQRRSPSFTVSKLDTSIAAPANSFAVSDDGRYLATSFPADGGVLVRDLRGGGLSRLGGQSDETVTFAPDSSLLATSRRVLEPSSSSWRELARVEDSLSSEWAGARLAMVTPKGVRVWARDGERLLPFHFRFAHHPGRIPAWNVGMRGSAGKLAVWEAPAIALATDRELLEVYDLESGRRLVGRRDLGAVASAEFRGDTLVVLSLRGWEAIVTDLDLATGEVLREKNLGRWGRGTYRVSPEQSYFSPVLLPGGKVLALLKGGTHDFVSMTP